MAGDHYFLELEPPEERLRHAPHVVIVGGGFAGIQACRALAQSDRGANHPDRQTQLQFVPAVALSSSNWIGRERRHCNTPTRASGQTTKRANPARRSHAIDPR